MAWRTTGIGSGYSSVAVVGERVYTLGDVDGGQHAFGLRRSDGDAVWKTRIGPPWATESYDGSRSTPTVDGDRVFVLGTEGDLYSLDAASGEPIWHRHVSDFGGYQMTVFSERSGATYNWKYSESPLVDQGRVIVTPGASGAALVALARDSGEEIWRAEVPALGEAGADGAGYASAVVSTACGVRQYVQLLGRGVVGIEAESGRYLWGYNRVANGVANIPTPLATGQYVFASSGYGTGAALLRLECGDGDEITAHEEYFLEGNVMQNHHGGLILHENHVYTGTGHNRGFPLAVAIETGEVAWGPIRNEGRNSAAIAYADGRLYFRYQDGRMILVGATPSGYEEHGSFMIPDVERESWSHPVIADGHLFLREQDTLFCYDIRATTSGE